ncbi:MAG: magnesium transporter [Eubacteriaceae bacterium]|nr:magnesium transporter [Eubacteriaceae bacterium]
MANEIRGLLAQVSDRTELKAQLGAMNVVHIAEELEEMDKPEVVKVIRLLSKNKAAETFACLDSDVQQGIIEAIADSEIGSIIDELFLDDAVDFIEEMPADVVNRVLANVTRERRNLINQFLKYPEDSAGSIMTIEYVELKSEMTVASAFAQILSTGYDKETIYTCYITNAAKTLLGQVSAKDLLLSEQEKTVGEIMEQNVVFARTNDDKEELMAIFRKYGFLAIPIVDSEDHLVGIVTYDDAFTIQEEEATEDFEKMAAITPFENDYLKTGVIQLSKNRIPWLMFLMIFGTLTDQLTKLFEDSLAIMPALVAFIPMLMNTGGNAGTQSSTLIIRGMALDEIQTSDIGKVLAKELFVSLQCGIVLVIASYVCVIIFGEGFMVAVTVSLAVLATIVMSNITGTLLTFGARALKMDPAIIAAPLLTNIVDCGALVVYFVLAKAILKV